MSNGNGPNNELKKEIISGVRANISVASPASDASTALRIVMPLGPGLVVTR